MKHPFRIFRSKNGNDANTGTKKFPWRTAKRLMGVMVALVLLCGTVFAQAAGPTFFYVVTTVDVNGFESAFSSQATDTFTQGKHISSLSWTAATVPTGGAAIAGYNIYRGTVTGGPYTKINTALVTSVTYSDTFVLPNAPSGPLTVTTN